MEKIKSLKPVIIISRSFPPSPLTAAARVQSFAENLHNHGYYPIVITRNWDLAYTDYISTHMPSGKQLVHIKKDNYEVYYVPFKGRFSERKFWKSNRLFLKMAALFDIYLGWHYFFDPHYSLYKFADLYLKQNKHVTSVVVSVPPFILLSFGFLLKKKHKLKLLVDYRDEWNTAGKSVIEEKPVRQTVFTGILKLFNGNNQQLKREKKWIKAADTIITISEEAKQNLGSIYEKPIEVLPNGFVEEELNKSKRLMPDSDIMQISYAGWLYPAQQVELFFEIIKKMVDETPAVKLKVVFIGGLSFSGMEQRIMKLMKGYEQYVELTGRVSKAVSLEMQRRSSLLLLVAHKNTGAIPSSKLYEYIGLERQVMLVPGDNGIMQKELLTNGIGLVINSLDEGLAVLKQHYNDFLNRNYKAIVKVPSNRNGYERRHLVKVLAETLNNF